MEPFYSVFHTGENGGSFKDARWDQPVDDPAKKYFKYWYREGWLNINSDGSYTQLGGTDLPSRSTIDEIYNAGAIPILKGYLCNSKEIVSWLSSVKQSAINKFILNLSNSFGLSRHGIFAPYGEYNYNEGATPFGGWREGYPGYGHCPTYAESNEVMQLLRNALDTQGIKNVMLGIHLNAGHRTDVYMDGIRKADIPGASFYQESQDYPTVASAFCDDSPGCSGSNCCFNWYNKFVRRWALHKSLWAAIGGNKPWLFYEYGNWSNWSTAGDYPMNKRYVDASYAMLPSNPWVKGFIWYFKMDAMIDVAGTVRAIRDGAKAYEGVIPVTGKKLTITAGAGGITVPPAGEYVF